MRFWETRAEVLMLERKFEMAEDRSSGCGMLVERKINLVFEIFKSCSEKYFHSNNIWKLRRSEFQSFALLDIFLRQALQNLSWFLLFNRSDNFTKNTRKSVPNQSLELEQINIPCSSSLRQPRNCPDIVRLSAKKRAFRVNIGFLCA